MYVNGGSVMAIGIIFPILGTVAVAGRFAARISRNTGLKADDWLCIPALAILIGTGVVFIYGSARKTIGYNMYSQEPPPPLLEELEFIIDAMNPIGTGLIRLSFLFFYRRIFRGRAFNITSWFMIGVVISWIVALTIVTFAQCRTHLSAIWTSFPEMREYCVNTTMFLGLIGITSFIIDVFILAMPFFWIWRLHMPTSQKLAVTSVFLCGAFTISASAVRMAAGITAIQFELNIYQNILGLKGDNHVTGGTCIWLFWQYIEHGTGLVVCCMPTLKGLVIRGERWWIYQLSPSLRSFKSLSWIRRSGKSVGDDCSFGPDEKDRDITITNSVEQYTASSAASQV